MFRDLLSRSYLKLLLYLIKMSFSDMTVNLRWQEKETQLRSQFLFYFGRHDAVINIPA